MAYRPTCSLATFLLLGAVPAVALAATGTLQGVVVPPSKVAAPPSEDLGFLPPIENPIVELRQYDPLPECFVFLDGGPEDATVPEPKSAVVWQLESHSFIPPLLPVMSGTHVELANVGRETHLLVAPGHDDLLPKDPIGPGSSRTISVPGHEEAVRIVSRTSPHLVGRVVPLPSPYFSRLDRNGRFRIENVPVGRWTLRVWYRDGWAHMPPRTVEVPARDVKVELNNDALSVKGRGSGPAPVK